MSDTSIPLRADIKDEDKWDLTPLFKTDEEWETLYRMVEEKLPGYKTFQGRLGESFEIFHEALIFDTELSRDLEKLYVRAHLKNDEDKTNQDYAGFFQKAMNLYTRISEAASFMIPEIQAVPDETMAGYLKQEAIGEFRFPLEKILRRKAHTRNQEIEQILALSSEISQVPRQIFSQLDNADLNFGKIEDENGKEVELSHGNFVSFLTSQDRDTRERAFRQYYKVYHEHRFTISTALASSIKKDLFFAKVRNFDTCRQAELFADNVSESVYDNLLETMKTNTEPLFRYFRLRKKLLGVDDLHFYDTYVSLVKDIDFKMTYDEAVDTCLKAVAPLGQEYCDILEKGLKQGWVDRYENKGKRSGAYSSGCYDSPPYILMNYNKTTINSLFTLIHEAGHSMHTWYSCMNQPFATHDYTIFVAEVASTLNETLLGKYLMKKYEHDPKMKAWLINREIDNIRATMFRQTMFAEFEMVTHGMAEKNIPLTLETMTAEYRKLLEIYFGDTMMIDEELCLECLRIPHFYSPFYVYKYATGIAAAIAICGRIETLGEQAVGDYLGFLKMGGSAFPIDELKMAGVDMNRPEPVENAISHFGKLVEQLEEIL